MDKRAASEKGITTMEWTTQYGHADYHGYTEYLGYLGPITTQCAASILAEAIEHWLKADMYRTWEWTW